MLKKDAGWLCAKLRRSTTVSNHGSGSAAQRHRKEARLASGQRTRRLWAWAVGSAAATAATSIIKARHGDRPAADSTDALRPQGPGRRVWSNLGRWAVWRLSAFGYAGPAPCRVRVLRPISHSQSPSLVAPALRPARSPNTASPCPWYAKGFKPTVRASLSESSTGPPSKPSQPSTVNGRPSTVDTPTPTFDADSPALQLVAANASVTASRWPAEASARHLHKSTPVLAYEGCISCICLSLFTRPRDTVLTADSSEPPSPHNKSIMLFINRNLVSVLAAATALLSTAQAASSSVSLVLIPSATTKPPASVMATAGCFATGKPYTGTPLEDHGPGPFITSGECQFICLGLEKNVLGLSEGNRCWCGDELPPLNTKVSNTSCSTGCAGSDSDNCGGASKLWVMTTGFTRNQIDYAENVTESSSSSSSSASSTGTSSSAAASSASAAAASASASSSPNTAGIAAGVVVGVVGLAAIIGGVFLWLRQKKRREVEEEYRRQAAVNNFVGGGKQMHTSNSSMTDSRLDPDFLARRQSNGSIADNEDYSRRILKVTNA
ncbi:hypothetical protein P280DRAFT_479882 [Massarina eburnea CBS 473.64]|uniref:WSC domain-containing protein n=1 Tax=Massarina eburnea CBS 473.64 TaxID=1395130 RepID=A0A6A6S330_9PLEO|nr:hypothetical protein P280DRAFT_479882 [Massarina eburnea CBS 473.64]